MSQYPDQQNLAQNQPQHEAAPGHKSATTEAHRAESPDSVRCYILTVSDTRTSETDESGALIEKMLEEAGHEIVLSQIVRDEAPSIADAVGTALTAGSDPEVVILTGGTGIGPRDVTTEAIQPLLTKDLPGFGEIFRMLSYEEIGAATMLSRAFAGVMGRTLIFALPGSVNAVRLAMEKLIVPEVCHLVREVRPERRK